MTPLKPAELALLQLKAHLAGNVSTRALAIEEFWIPRTHERADLVVVDKEMIGFEVKSAKDNLKRLPRQVDAYSRVFERCHVVVADRHLEDSLAIVPDWWGVMRLPDDELRAAEVVRRSQANPDPDAETLVRLLWKDEAVATLDRLRISYDASMPRFGLWGTIVEGTSTAGVIENVRKSILARDITKARIPSRRFQPSPTAA